VEIAGEGSHVLTGLVVDAVSEVLNIKADNIEAPFSCVISYSLTGTQISCQNARRGLFFRQDNLGRFADDWNNRISLDF